MPTFQVVLSDGIKDPRAQEAIKQKTFYHLLYLTQLHTRSTSFKGRFSKVSKAERLLGLFIISERDLMIFYLC